MRQEISYSEMRKGLKGYLDQVCLEHTALLITRRKGENVILLCEDDYRSLEETAYLSRSPRNLKRLQDALDRKEGKSLDDVRKELGI
ncbi:MAG: type II toxin-antitoxin system Phd/YefM family antitoxin [Alphaproteobacteria bacterium]|nr:type II toxin-antitoxin system Phd/YefM family antitoxin [Alphaproteobacteria bacterium]